MGAQPIDGYDSASVEEKKAILLAEIGRGTFQDFLERHGVPVPSPKPEPKDFKPELISNPVRAAQCHCLFDLTPEQFEGQWQAISRLFLGTKDAISDNQFNLMYYISNLRIPKSRADLVVHEKQASVDWGSGVAQNACRVSFIGATSPIPSRAIGDQQLVGMGDRWHSLTTATPLQKWATNCSW
jgi:hypothetical protein